MKNTRLFLQLSVVLIAFFVVSQKTTSFFSLSRSHIPVDIDASYTPELSSFVQTDEVKEFAIPSHLTLSPEAILRKTIAKFLLTETNTNAKRIESELKAIEKSRFKLAHEKPKPLMVEDFNYQTKPQIKTAKTAKKEKQIVAVIESDYSKTAHISYWDTVYSIESKQGKLLYRPRNKARNCTYTTAPCGHHQLTVQALKDIGCHSLQCRKDRLNFKKSLAMSKKLLALNEKRLRKNGIVQLKDYQRYLIHQQGATGIRHILDAIKGKRSLSRTVKRNMANNSPYSYKQFKRMGSKLAANTFMQHWANKWQKEKLLIAGIQVSAADNQINAEFTPSFSDKEILLALNYKF